MLARRNTCTLSAVPATAPLGSNFPALLMTPSVYAPRLQVAVTACVDPRTGWVVTLCALDNLVKGASGQAIQCATAALGLPETTGLPIAGVYP